MKLPRRNFLHLTAGAAALGGVARIACAQAYPSRPVRIVVGLTAGSASDIVARLVGQWLSERLGQQFIVENRADVPARQPSARLRHRPPSLDHLVGAGKQRRQKTRTISPPSSFSLTSSLAVLVSALLFGICDTRRPPDSSRLCQASCQANPGRPRGLLYASGP
jgi:hypothetical protein